MLFRYELQKIFSKRANWIVMLLLVLLVGYSASGALRAVEWGDGQGNFVTGHAAARKLQEAQAEWSGILDEEMLQNALAKIQKVYWDTREHSESMDNNWAFRSQLQGVQKITDLLTWSFAEEYETFDEMMADIQPEDMTRFYSNRDVYFQNYLYKEGSWAVYNYTEAEKQYILEKAALLETPIQLHYHEGWVQAAENLPTFLKYGIILLSFLLAGIFSDEFTLKTDAVYYNTVYGRTKATRTKILAGFLLLTLGYTIGTAAYTLVVLGNLGFGGAGDVLQSDGIAFLRWRSMTLSQKYLLAIGMGYIGFLFIGFLVMLVSTKTRSPVLAVVLPSLLILLPQFFSGIQNDFAHIIKGILPDKLLDLNDAMYYLYLYSFGDWVTNCVPILLVLYPCMTALLPWLCYRVYRHKQIT